MTKELDNKLQVVTIKEKKHMVKISSLVILYILFDGQDIPDHRKKDVQEVIVRLTGIEEYWEIPNEAKWIPRMRANMELVIRNVFLDFPLYATPDDFLFRYPVEVSVNLDQKGMSIEEIAHLVKNGWLTPLGFIE